jgi:hypothetical protein
MAAWKMASSGSIRSDILHNAFRPFYHNMREKQEKRISRIVACCALGAAIRWPMRVVTAALREAEKEALVDLLVLGMYADHKLESAEDDYLEQLLDTFQFSSDYERQTFADAAFTRASRHADSLKAIREYVVELSGRFSSQETRRAVYETLDELLTRNGFVSAEENQMLSVVRHEFGLDKL